MLGTSAGDAVKFTTVLVGGELAGKTSEVAVTVRAVNVRELPEANDEWANTAAGFDSIGDLREDVRSRLDRVKRLEQGVAARDKVLEALLAVIEIPLPESVVATEVSFRRQMTQDQFNRSGLTLEGYLEHEDKTEEQFETELLEGAQGAVKAQFVLDAIAEKEELSVQENELSDQIVRRAARAGVGPDQFAQSIVQSGQLPGLIADLWSIHDYTTIAPGGINDRLARIALEPARRATLLARTRGIIRANYPLVRRWIEQQDGLSHVAPEAGR